MAKRLLTGAASVLVGTVVGAMLAAAASVVIGSRPPRPPGVEEPQYSFELFWALLEFIAGSAVAGAVGGLCAATLHWRRPGRLRAALVGAGVYAGLFATWMLLTGFFTA